MSDIILKFWPQDEVTDNKTAAIKDGLLQAQLIGDETEFWDKPAFRPGSKFNTFFEPLLEPGSEYFQSLAVVISDEDYGVVEGDEDFEFIDRLNVVSILGGDGTFENWSVMTELLRKITGDEYQGGYEML